MHPAPEGSGPSTIYPKEENMSLIDEKFARLSTDDAPGQEVRQSAQFDDAKLRGEKLEGTLVDFSHGDVNANAFEPTPGALEEFIQGVRLGGQQAYTEYRGRAELRDSLSQKLTAFTGRSVSGSEELIITPGTQGALFLAVASTVSAGDKVAIVRPDYFANRKLVEFMGAEVVPVQMHYLESSKRSGIDLTQLEAAFMSGAKTFLFSNPNNPAGVVYASDEIQAIAGLANRYGATVIVDQLYSRLLYPGHSYTHLRTTDINQDNLVTIMGPSKTESLSGYRLGVAFGGARIIERMERLQAIVSLRAPGYCQAVLRTWFDEPDGWLQDRITRHQAIRDELVSVLESVDGVSVRATEAGSYIFPRFPALSLSPRDFLRVLRLQGGVIATPGTEFDPHSTSSLRFNFSQNHKAAVEAMRRTAQLIDRYRA